MRPVASIIHDKQLCLAIEPGNHRLARIHVAIEARAASHDQAMASDPIVIGHIRFERQVSVVLQDIAQQIPVTKRLLEGPYGLIPLLSVRSGDRRAAQLLDIDEIVAPSSEI
jgi:hypothetical protein